jgi:hypothetical protein
MNQKAKIYLLILEADSQTDGSRSRVIGAQSAHIFSIAGSNTGAEREDGQGRILCAA